MRIRPCNWYIDVDVDVSWRLYGSSSFIGLDWIGLRYIGCGEIHIGGAVNNNNDNDNDNHNHNDRSYHEM